MSFILDALRKSDQMRQTNAAPTLTTMQPAAPGTRSRSLNTLILSGIALLGAGLVIGWWQPWATQPQSLPQTVVTQLTERVAPPPTQAAPPEAPVTFTAPLPSAVTTPHPVSVPARATAKPQAIAAIIKTPAIDTAADTAANAPAEAPPMALSELPPALLAELPKLAVSAHSYSKKPKASFVFINDRMLHESDTLPPGLKLERITADGMIFSYKGYRFHRGLQP